ncbi:unnamed protein product [Leptidea sinapis]|uniref:Uncharacterized protein n=1 Tax=Leptidea sinapis TaxID=189913 RepID=A0A5E4PNJ4_9NEOP|nr:unnamed protein product [Leptidea sinapis]
MLLSAIDVFTGDALHWFRSVKDNITDWPTLINRLKNDFDIPDFDYPVSTFINDDHRSWDLNLPQIQFAMNNSVNETTGFTPAFLVHGRELVTCGSHYLDTDDSNDIIFLPRDAYAENLGHLSIIFGKVQSALRNAHIKNTQRYNLRRREFEFNEGDIVWKRCYFQSDKDAHFSKNRNDTDDMNKTNFMKWHQEKLIPNLPANSLVVMDNAYHTVKLNKAPTLSSTKAEMQKWITNNGLSW